VRELPDRARGAPRGRTPTCGGGLVLGEIVECPRHQGRFHIPTGKAKGAPVVMDLRTYPTKVEGGQVYIGLKAREIYANSSALRVSTAHRSYRARQVRRLPGK
jgi:hypothetical protein